MNRSSMSFRNGSRCVHIEGFAQIVANLTGNKEWCMIRVFQNVQFTTFEESSQLCRRKGACFASNETHARNAIRPGPSIPVSIQ